MHSCWRIAFTGVVLLSATGPAFGQALQPPFDMSYTIVDLGSVPGLPPLYGGLTFKYDDPNVLLIGGNANTAPGSLYSIGVTRDAMNHVSGFVGMAAFFADAAYNDGGVVYGPSNVLFLARWPVNELGQTKAGSSITDKIIDMTPFGVGGSSLSALNFIPAGFPGAGLLKLVSYSAGNWYTAGFAPDGMGTFDITGVTLETQIIGGPEGILYVPPGSPQFVDYTSLLVCEYALGNVVAYQVDPTGDPIPATRTVFLSGLAGAEGAVSDPLTGDFLFSTFGGGDHVFEVRGFGMPTCPPAATVARYGAGLAGSGALVPEIDVVGCPSLGITITVEITNGLGAACGCLVLGTSQASIPAFGGNLLVSSFDVVVSHDLGGTAGVAGAGTFSLPIAVPNDTALLGGAVFGQAGYLDAGAPAGVSLTEGIQVTIG
jgi:hypothetical protein